MNTNSHEKKGIKLPVPRLRGNGLIKQLCFAAALTFGASAFTPVFANTGNTPPVLTGFGVTLNENQSAIAFSNGGSAWSDADGDQPAAMKVVSLPSFGVLTLNGDGINAGDVIAAADVPNIIYTPTLGYHGTDNFSWNATDGIDYAAQNAIVTLTVVNQAPVVVDEAAYTNENADIQLSSPPVGFFTDAENDAMVALKVVALPSNGTLLLSGLPVQAGDVIATADMANLVYRPNFLFSGADQFVVNATDGISFAVNNSTVSVTVAHVDFAPSDIALSGTSVSENMPSGTVIGTVSATVVDPNATLTYALVAGAGDADNGSFAILSGNQLIATQAFNYEVQSSLSIRLRVEDANGTSYEKSFTIAVQDVVETATDIAMTSTYIAENQPVGSLVGSFATIDDETTATFSYDLVAGAGDTDNASFTIDGNQLLSAAVCDFETKAQYSIRVSSKDNNGNTFEKQLTINVTDANDAPTNIALTNTSVADNQPAGVVVGDFSATDQDLSDTHTYTLVSGAGSTDNGAFTISGSTLSTAIVLNASMQPTYSVRVKCEDGAGASTEKQFVITASATTQGITGISLSSAGVNENALPGAVVGTLSSISPDQGQTYTYSFVQGAGCSGNSMFAINGNVLVTSATFDYETQNAYTVRVRSTNSNGQHFDKVLPIIIRNVNDVPTSVSLTLTNTNENLPGNTAIGFMSTADQDLGDNHTYTLVAGAGDQNNSSFSINGNKLVAINSFDFEAQAIFNVRVRSTDGAGASTENAFTINVTDVNEAPSTLTLAVTSINENMPAGSVISSLASTDQDRGDTHTYSLVAGAGDDDNASFAISGSQLVSTEVFNYEAKSQYSIRIATTDAGGLSLEKQVTVTINNVNDAPVASAFNISMQINSVLDLFSRNFTQSYTDEEHTALSSIRISSTPAEGILTLNGRTITANTVIDANELNNLKYTPNHNFTGVDSFEWLASDGTDYSTAAATVSINVQMAGSHAAGEHRIPTVHGPLALQPSAWTASHSGANKEGDEQTAIGQTDAQIQAMTVNNYPNPFASSTTIKYDLPADMHVTVKIFDLSGKEIKTLVDAPQAAGSYTTVWSGNGSSMDAVAEGEYIYMLSAKNAAGDVTVKTGKMVKMK